MTDEKPVVEIKVTGIDFVAIEPHGQGSLIVLFTTGGTHELALRISPQIVSVLEERLDKAQQRQADRRPVQ